MNAPTQNNHRGYQLSQDDKRTLATVNFAVNSGAPYVALPFDYFPPTTESIQLRQHRIAQARKWIPQLMKMVEGSK